MAEFTISALGAREGQPLVGVHYLLHGYVCGNGCFQSSRLTGWATFTVIFNHRPNQCRFAVAKLVPVFDSEPRGPWVCWDLYDNDLMKPPEGGWVTAPYPKWQGESADGLVMKAMHLYDRE